MNVTKGLFVVTGSLFSSPLAGQHGEIVKRLENEKRTNRLLMICPFQAESEGLPSAIPEVGLKTKE
jgi:hypothetical protein